jgi:protein gp37
MTQCPQHIFQVLTKRSERMRELSPRLPWPGNLWMGVTVESNRYFSRIDDLRAVPSAVRFLSCEPLLSSLEGIDLAGIDWVIAGGESGPKARPMKPEWARDLRDSCSRQGTAFFFKQWGGANRRATGRRLDGRLYSEVPPQLAVHDPQLSLGF